MSAERILGCWYVSGVGDTCLEIEAFGARIIWGCIKKKADGQYYIYSGQGTRKDGPFQKLETAKAFALKFSGVTQVVDSLECNSPEAA